MNRAMKQASARPAFFYGWFVVAAAFFIAFATMGTRHGFGLFVLPMSGEFGWSRGTISVAASLGFLVNGVSQPFMGVWYDRVGGRRLVLISLVVLGASTALLALTNHILFLVLVFGVVASLATSGGSMNITSAMLTKWFHRKRATAVSISAAGASIGGLVLVPFAAYLIAWVGWRPTWAVLGLILLVLVVPVAFLLLKDDPKEMGLQPDGDAQSMDGTAGGATRAARGPLEVEYWLESFRSLPMWQLCGGYAVCGFTTAIISTHFVPYAIEQGYSAATAATAFGVMGGLNTVGVLLAGFFGDKFGRKNLLGLVYALRGCGYAALLLAPGLWGLWGFAVIAGVSWLATIPLTTSLTADLYGLKRIGILSGIGITAHQFGGALGIQVGGVLRDLTGSYDIPFTIAGLLLIAAALASFSIQEKKYSARYQVASSSAAT
jgi:MFS family permease